MGQSNNPDGKARVTDQELIDVLKQLHRAEPDKLAFGASDVAADIPIGRQATRKRLDKLAKTDTVVERYKATRSWHYFIPGMNKYTHTIDEPGPGNEAEVTTTATDTSTGGDPPNETSTLEATLGDFLYSMAQVSLSLIFITLFLGLWNRLFVGINFGWFDGPGFWMFVAAFGAIGALSGGTYWILNRHDHRDPKDSGVET